MAKYLDVESLVIVSRGHTPDDEFSKGVDFVLDLLDSKPPADVRPVVLCKDCVHWDCDTIEMHDRCNNVKEGVDKTQARFAECLYFSSWAKRMMMCEDDYCSVGRFAIRGIKDDANPCCENYNDADMRE